MREQVERGNRLQRHFLDLKPVLAYLARYRYVVRMLTLDHSPVRSDPCVLGGTLTFRGTRVKAQTLLDYLDAGDYEFSEIYMERFAPIIARERNCHIVSL